jgi:hypothetical protein
MKAAGRALNLKPHRCGLTREVSRRLWAAADVEGHLGLDDLFYLLGRSLGCHFAHTCTFSSLSSVFLFSLGLPLNLFDLSLSVNLLTYWPFSLSLSLSSHSLLFSPSLGWYLVVIHATIDFSRTLPPVKPSKAVHNGHLYRMFRKVCSCSELLGYTLQLCWRALLGWVLLIVLVRA